MAAGSISSEKIDLLVYGPIRPILENGFSDQFVLHMAESRADLERLTPDVLAKTRGIAVTYHTVPADGKALAHFPKLEIIASFGVGYDHVDSAYAREHNIVVTNTPDVLTEEVADVAMGLLIATLREFVKADRYLRSGQWQTQSYPLSAGSLRDRKIGIVGMGRIGKAIARRLEAFVPCFAFRQHDSRRCLLGHAYRPFLYRRRTPQNSQGWTILRPQSGGLRPANSDRAPEENCQSLAQRGESHFELPGRRRSGRRRTQVYRFAGRPRSGRIRSISL
jgi:hypothetical protein